MSGRVLGFWFLFFHLLETENTHLNGRPEWARFLRCKSHGVGSIGRPFEIGREGWNRMAGIKWGSPGATIAIEKGNFSSKVFSKTKKWIKNPKRQWRTRKWEGRGTAAMMANGRTATNSKWKQLNEMVSFSSRNNNNNTEREWQPSMLMVCCAAV